MPEKDVSVSGNGVTTLIREKDSVNELSGRTACPGKVSGKVCKIMNISELGKMQEGSILVTTMTSPEYVPAMAKAKAIVTDEGGMACHAAIVAREFGIPCIVGTRKATSVLSDGDEIEVDAGRSGEGTISKLN